MYIVFFFQAEDGIRDLVRSRGLGDVYKRQGAYNAAIDGMTRAFPKIRKKLAALSTAEQLQSVAAEARTLSLKTTREHIESELELSLIHI